MNTGINNKPIMHPNAVPLANSKFRVDAPPNQSDVALHSRYNIINCAIWAFYNSGTHEIDGSYRNGQK